MRVYCDNEKCQFFIKLKDKKSFQFRKGYYKPFEEDFIKGECSCDEIIVNSVELHNRDISQDQAICGDDIDRVDNPSYDCMRKAEQLRFGI